MSKYYVTQGKQDRKLKSPQHEKWEQLSIEKLEYLEMDLPCIEGEDVGFDRDDISVPSPWANVVLFDSMLANKDSAFGALSKKTKTEWRALITLLALKKILNIKVDFRRISIAGNVEGNTADRNFFDRLYNMRPKVSLFKDENSWKDIHLIEIYGQTVGLISDSSLVCSLYKYKDNEAVKLLVDRGLMNDKFQWIDPISMIKSDISLSAFMLEWLEALREWIIQNGRNTSVLTRLIEEFVDGINSERLRRFHEQDDADKFINIKVKSNNEILRAYDVLTSIEVANVNFENDMVLKYISVEGKVNTYILEFLSPATKMLFTAYEDRCQKPEGVTLNETALFEDNLYLFDCVMACIGNSEDAIDKNMLVERTDEEGITTKFQIVLPIKEDVLGIVSVEKLRKDLAVEQFKDGSIKISIRFRIEDEIKYLEKIYDADSIKELPRGEYTNIDMWPYVRFVDSHSNETLWNEYYVYLRNHNNGLELRAKYFGVDWENEWKNACVWENDNETPGNIRVMKYECIPTYVAVVVVNDITEREKCHGIVLLKEPELAEVNKAKTARVGVDFGTSSTTAFYTIEDEGENQEPKFISFGHRGIDNIEPSVGGNDDNAAYGIYNIRPKGELLDRKYQNRRSYPSLIYKCDNGQHSAVSRIEEPFKWGKIQFKPQGDRDVSGRRIINDMKWGKDQLSQAAVESYLGQITKYIACTLARNGIGSIIWRFSYPTAMSTLYKFMDKSKNIVNSIQKNLKIDSKLIPEKGFFPESIVSAKFFSDTDDYICVDIGGGSSDISVWRGGYEGTPPKNILQFSVGIASRKIFLAAFADLLLLKDKEEGSTVKELIKSFDYISQSNEVKFAIDKYIEEFEKEKANAIEIFSRKIEPVFLLTGDDMRKTVSDNSQALSVMKFYRAIALGLWGILYYTAISFKYIKESFEDKNRTIVFHFAGTGSKMFEWLSDEYKERLRKTFSDVLNAALGKLPGEEYKISEFEYDDKKLKTEAAIGLLKMKESEREAETNIILPNAGITHIEGQKIYPDDNIFVNDNLKTFFTKNDEHFNEVNVDFEEKDVIFEDFIRLFNEKIVEESNLAIEIPDTALMKSEARRIIKDNQAKNTIAPAFIVKLEALIRCIRETK